MKVIGVVSWFCSILVQLSCVFILYNNGNNILVYIVYYIMYIIIPCLLQQTEIQSGSIYTRSVHAVVYSIQSLNAIHFSMHGASIYTT